MIETTLAIPSEVNIYNIVAESEKPLETSGSSYDFYNKDDCGTLTPVDITGFDFSFVVYFNDCEYLTGSTITGELVKGMGGDNNKVWFDIDTLNLDRGQYQYKIFIVDDISVIKGNFEVK